MAPAAAAVTPATNVFTFAFFDDRRKCGARKMTIRRRTSSPAQCATCCSTSCAWAPSGAVLEDVDRHQRRSDGG
jgi:hypothetical protein